MSQLSTPDEIGTEWAAQHERARGLPTGYTISASGMIYLRVNGFHSYPLRLAEALTAIERMKGEPDAPKTPEATQGELDFRVPPAWGEELPESLKASKDIAEWVAAAFAAERSVCFYLTVTSHPDAAFSVVLIEAIQAEGVRRNKAKAA